MTNFVIDVNTLINALINSESKAANILLQKPAHIHFFSCHYLYIELLKHKDKVLKLSGLAEEDFLDLLYSLMSNIEFINESYIPFHCWQQSNQLLQEIDPKDIPYLALAIHTDSVLWTADNYQKDSTKQSIPQPYSLFYFHPKPLITNNLPIIP